jgi:hypothetical protein
MVRLVLVCDGMATHGRNALESSPRREAAKRKDLSFASRHGVGLLVALVVGLLAAAVLLWAGGLVGERRALLRMNPEERRGLYDETRRNAEAICSRAGTEPALRDRCIDSASFLLAFPECDEACQTFARAHGREPTR